MTTTTVDIDTELSAVNAILGSIGQSPISGLDFANPEISFIYNLLKESKIDVLLDDTDEHLSAKFKKFDLIGIPHQIILGSKSNESELEFKELNGKTELLSLEKIKNKLLKSRN